MARVPTTLPASTYPSIGATGVSISSDIVQIDATTFAHRRVTGRIPASSGFVTLELGTIYDNAEIRYTTNGKNPNKKSKLYESPLTFTKNLWYSDRTVIKARVYDLQDPSRKSKIIRIEFNVVNSAL